MSNPTPNSPSQLIVQVLAQVLENELPKALSPIVTRLDRLEYFLMERSPVTQDQLSHSLALQKQEIFSQQLNCDRSLSNALIDLAERLEQREIEREGEIELLSRQMQAQRQDLTHLTILPNVLNQLIDRIEQLEEQANRLLESNQQQSQKLTALEQNLSDRQQIDHLLKAMPPLHEQFSRDSQQLSSSLMKLTDNLVLRERERSQQMETLIIHQQNLTQSHQLLSQQFNEQQQTEQQQTTDKLLDVLMESSNSTLRLSEASNSLKHQFTHNLNQLTEQVQQWHQQQTQQLNSLNHDIEARITTLVNVLTPLPDEVRLVGEESSQRLNNLQQELTQLSNATNKLASELLGLVKVLQP